MYGHGQHRCAVCCCAGVLTAPSARQRRMSSTGDATGLLQTAMAGRLLLSPCLRLKVLYLSLEGVVRSQHSCKPAPA
jgi:hypothetical protein